MGELRNKGDIDRAVEIMETMEKRKHELTHRFCNGVYLRQMKIPKDTAVIGKINKTAHSVILSKGVLSIKTQNSEELIVAPHTFISKVGDQRAVVAITDVVITTIHPTTETDIDVLEQLLVCDTEEDYTNYLDDKKVLL